MKDKIIEELYETGMVKKALWRMRCPADRVQDIEQDLYVSWLESSDALVKAYVDGYLSQYVYKSCQHMVSRIRSEREFVSIDDLNI